ncbi:hypothetical protein DTO212C5_6697 [Paecilomyces variotii]|nr:hypothetical protein DTO212C5_6697 [Paecilomyces variotii]
MASAFVLSVSTPLRDDNFYGPDAMVMPPSQAKRLKWRSRSNINKGSQKVLADLTFSFKHAILELPNHHRSQIFYIYFESFELPIPPWLAAADNSVTAAVPRTARVAITVPARAAESKCSCH